MSVLSPQRRRNTEHGRERMDEMSDLEVLLEKVEGELRVLQERLPVWAAGAPYLDPTCPPELPGRRVRERLERLERAERRGRHERERERQARERTRPWQEQDRFGLRKRVWQERTGRECELVDLRERALLTREEELADWLARREGWLRDLAELDPSSRAWCAEQMRRGEDSEVSVAELAELQRRRREAAASRARALLAREDVRASLGPVLAGAGRDAAMIAGAITPALAGHRSVEDEDAGVLPVLLAAVALELARGGRLEEGRRSGD
jgi:hypothetical protein